MQQSQSSEAKYNCYVGSGCIHQGAKLGLTKPAAGHGMKTNTVLLPPYSVHIGGNMTLNRSIYVIAP